MAGYVYVKSIIWITALGGLGYVLMQVTTPSPEKIKQLQAKYSSAQLREDNKTKDLFLDKLKQSITDNQKVGGPTEK